MDLFELQCVLPTLTLLVSKASTAIANIARKGHPIVVAFSSGKDSGVVLALVLSVARELVASGQASPKIVVTSSDTLGNL